MQVTLNNTQISLAESPMTLVDFIAQHCAKSQGVAVAINNAVVPKSEWENTVLAHGDSIDVFEAIAGG